MAKLKPKPYAKVVSPSGHRCPPPRLGSTALGFMDRIAGAHVSFSGTPVSFWSQDIVNSIRDPLYDEVVDRAWRGPYRIMAHVMRPDRTSEAREEGTRWTWTSQIWIPRKSLEMAGVASPKEGDVVQIWSEFIYYEQEAVGHTGEENGGMYFDITNVEHDGHVFDSGAFVGFRCDLTRRTEFSAERKLRD